MRSFLNGERQPRNPYLAREAPSSAKPEPSKFAGDRMEWTSGHTAACLIVYSIVTLSITTEPGIFGTRCETHTALRKSVQGAENESECLR